MKCAKRNEIIKEKRNQVKETQSMTYSGMTQATTPASLPNFNIPTKTKEEPLKINMSPILNLRKKNRYLLTNMN